MTTTAREKTRGRAAHLGPERRRPQLLDAALEIAVAQGISAVTSSAVAAHLGVSRPVVYSCFADRVELLEALLARESEHMLTATLDALRSARGDDPEAAFVAGYQALLRVVADRPQSWRLVFVAHPDPAVAGRFQQARAIVSRSAAQWLGPALKRWWQVDDLERKLPVITELFMSSCEAAVRLFLDTKNDWPIEALGDFFGRSMHRAFSGV
ncbi:MAG: TetR/AcrR family transcriptional regulator [Algiphilus sp.]